MEYKTLEITANPILEPAEWTYEEGPPVLVDYISRHVAWKGVVYSFDEWEALESKP